MQLHTPSARALAGCARMGMRRQDNQASSSPAA